MNKTSIDIKLKYNDMGKAERQIADWLLKNPGEILPLSIVELAEKCGCSEATIVRFAKRLGFSGYQGLKISLAQESNSRVISSKITKEDTPAEIYAKVCNDIYMTLEKTKQALDADAFLTAAEKIKGAGKVLVFGLGNSASIALDASHKFIRAGINSVSYSDNHMQVIAASQLGEGDVVVGISHSGSSKDIVEALSVARERGAFTIAITNEGKSPILKVSDVVLSTAAEETKHNLLALNSRIAQLSIIDTLYFYIVYQKNEKAMEAINQTEKSLLSKKY